MSSKFDLKKRINLQLHLLSPGKVTIHSQPKKKLKISHPPKLIGKKEPLKLAPGSLRAESLRLSLKKHNESRVRLESHTNNNVSPFQHCDIYEHQVCPIKELEDVFEKIENHFQSHIVQKKDACSECYDIGCDHCTCSNCENLGCGHCYFY